MTTYYVDPGASGANNGSSWTDAWTTVQSAFDTAVAGDIVYCRGAETLSVPIDIDTNSGSAASGHIKFIGCNASGNVDGTRYKLDGNSVASSCLYMAAQSFIWIENFELCNATGSGFDHTAAYYQNCVFINVISHDNGSHGFNLHYGASVSFTLLVRCQAYSNTSDGFYRSYNPVWFLFCESKDNGGYGFYLDNRYQILIGCLTHNNTNDGIYAASGLDGGLVLHSVIDGNGVQGCDVDISYFIIIGCRITNNSNYGLDMTASNHGLYGWNVLLNNTNGATTGAWVAIPYDDDTDTNETSGTEGYTDRANNDFNLTDLATLRSEAIALD